MTICVSVRVAEGLVLAADSAVMLLGSVKTPQGQATGVVQTFAFANKVTRVHDYPVGVMTWGLGSISARSIQSLIMEFEHEYPSLAENKKYTVKDVAEALAVFIKKWYNAAYPPKGTRPSLGLFVGGYGAGQFFSDQYEYEFPKSRAWRTVRPNNPGGSPSFGADWFGQADALIRLIKGFDRNGLEELLKRGVDKNVLQKWVNDNVAELQLVFDGMPLQDAIDFAEYAVQVVIGTFRFAAGPPLCGGDIDIAVITPSAYQWAQRKQWAIKEEWR